MGSRTKACALVLGALLFASPSLSAAAPSAAERETARKFMDEGNARMKANDPVRALESFLKAHELMHVPTTGLAVAKAQLAAGHLVEAREAAVDVARTSREPGEPPVFEKARKHAREIEAQVKNRIPTVRIHVRGGTPTRVAVDDNEIPLELVVEPVPVNPGKRLITAKAADGSEGKTDLDIQESEKKDIDVMLLPKGSVETPVAPPKDAGTTPPPTTTAPPKKVLGFGNEDIDTRAGRRTQLAEGLIYGGFGGAIIGVGVGAITGFMTLSKASSVAPQCARSICAPTAEHDLDSASTFATVSTIGFGVAIVGLGAGVLGLLIPREGGKHASLRLQPSVNGFVGTF